MQSKTKLLSTLTALLLLIACTDTSNILDDMSGVWRGVSDDAMITLNLTGESKIIVINDNAIPVTINSIDRDNHIVSLKINNDGETMIWTLRQTFVEGENSFTLDMTLHDGTNDELAFVRNLSPSDLSGNNGSIQTEDKSVEQLYSECVKGDNTSCSILIDQKLATMPLDKKKTHLQKLCVKYEVQMACSQLN